MYSIDISQITNLIKSISDTNVSVADFIRYKYVYRYLKELSQEIPVNAKCLDVGCGNGDFFRYIQNLNYIPVGIDMNISNINMNIHKGDMCHTIFEDNSIDVIVSIDSLYVEPLDAFKEFRRILKPGGYIIIHAPLPSSMQKHVLSEELKMQDDANRDTGNVRESTNYEMVHRQWYDLGELASIASNSGLNIISEHFAWGLFETFAYDIERLYYKDNNFIRSVAILLTSIDDMHPHINHKQPIGCITVLRK